VDGACGSSSSNASNTCSLRTQRCIFSNPEFRSNAVRDGHFDDEPSNVVTFEAFADLYLERYVKLRGLRSGDEIEQRLAVLKKRWQGKELAAIRVGEIEDLIHDLKVRTGSQQRSIAGLRCCATCSTGRSGATT
jgi:hypothetical protein